MVMTKATPEGYEMLTAMEEHYGMKLCGISEVERVRLFKTMFPDYQEERADAVKNSGNTSNHWRRVLDADQIIKMRQTMTITAIAKTLHSNYSSVRKVLEENGVIGPMQPNIYESKIKPNLGLIKELRSKGYKQKQIAEKIGVKASTLSGLTSVHMALHKAYNEGTNLWLKRKAEISRQTKEERVSNG